MRNFSLEISLFGILSPNYVETKETKKCQVFTWGASKVKSEERRKPYIDYQG